MSGDALVLEAEKREVVGKKVASLRKDGLVPAVVYERGKASESIAVPYLPLKKVWNSAGKHHTVVIKYGGKERLTMIKDATFDPVKGSISHIAFHAIKKNEVIEAEVPVKMDGLAPATVAGLLVRTNVDTVTVKGLPHEIPDEIVVDVTSIATADDDIRANQLQIPKDVTLLTDGETIIVNVIVPRAEVEKEEATEAADVPSDHGSPTGAEA